MNLIQKAKVLFASIAVSLSGMVYAQDSIAIHFTMHRDMLADQINMYNEVNLLDSLTMIYRLQDEDSEFPALELYGSWSNATVDPFRGQNVKMPDTLKVDVSSYVAPTMGHITSKYGWRRNRMHKGIDLKVQVGDTIVSAFDGKVRIRKYEQKGYGYYLVIRHTNGLETVYGHLSKFLVKEDDIVKAGQPIALGGNTGRSTGAHLHFETRLMGLAINPAEIIDFKNYVAHTDTWTFYSKRAKAIAKGTMSSNGDAFHRVRSGDTLSKISRKYGVSVSQLCKLNNIKSNTTLRIGQRIRY